MFETDPANLVRGASALLIVVLGVLVATLRPRRGANVAFAILCVCWGSVLAVNNLVADATALGLDAPRGVAQFIAGVAVFEVARRFPRPLAPGERRLLVLPAIASLVFFSVLLSKYAVERGSLSPAYERTGFLLMMVGDFALVCGFWAALFLIGGRLRRALQTAERQQFGLMFAGLVLYPAYEVGEALFDKDWYPWLGDAAAVVALLAVAVALHLVATAARSTEPRVPRNLALLTLGTALLGLLDFVDGSTSYGIGIARILAVAVFAYAIVRRQLFGIDVKVKWTLKQSTIAAIFIGLFFVASESAQAFFSDRIGTYVGILAAGALLFAIVPLQHVAQALADKAMPGVKGVGEMTSHERVAAYRVQVDAAWADGAISGDERRMLDAARRALGLDAETALRLEREAAP